MLSYFVFGAILSFSIIIVASLDTGSDSPLAFSAPESNSQNTGLLFDQADQLSGTQPTSLFDQIEPSEGSDIFASDATSLTSLSLGPDQLSHDPEDLFLNQSPSFLDVSTLSGGSESHLDDASNSLFESDVNSKSDRFDIGSLSDHTLFDNSFELADCANSGFPPGMGQKTRVKRLDDPESCENPTTAPPKGAETLPGGDNDESIELPDLFKILSEPEYRRKFAAAQRNRDRNSFCYLFSEGNLPWGVCSSGNPDNQDKLDEQLYVVTLGFFDAYELIRCTLGRSPFYNL